MNARSIVVLALILALLGAGLWYRRTFRDDARVMTSESLRPMVPADLNTTALDRIEISRPGSAAVILEKTDGSWRIPALGGVMASAQGVEHMLAAVGGLRGELRSSDPAVLRDFELESEQALGLVLHQGQTELAHLLFGKGDFRQVFAAPRAALMSALSPEPSLASSAPMVPPFRRSSGSIPTFFRCRPPRWRNCASPLPRTKRS